MSQPSRRSTAPDSILVVGGAGYVAGLVLPLLQENYRIRVFDRVSPTDPAWEFYQGDVCDARALAAAAAGMDLLLYMAMGKGSERSIQDPGPAYDVNVKGVHIAMEAAARAGIRRAVYVSSLSVHDGRDLRSGQFDSEEIPPEPRTVYGLTKWMGEEACRYAHRIHGLPILALRLFLPVSRDEWLAKHHEHAPVDPRTSAPDLARALTAALELEHADFQIIHITGDTSGRAFSHQKAKRLLNWQPLESA